MDSRAANERAALLDDPLTHSLSTAHDSSLSSGAPRRRVVDVLPRAAWCIILVEVCERFAYFGLNGPLQNYMQLPYSDRERPGGLGMGQRLATSLKLCFVSWCYVTPVFAAILADQYLGRLKTILFATWIYLAGALILFWSSSLDEDAFQLRRAALVVAMTFIGLGTGGIKTNANTLLVEQYRPPLGGTRVLDGGEIVEIDERATIQRIFMTFYVFVNIGSLLSFMTTFVEASSSGGFSSAFLLPLCAFAFGILVLLGTKHWYTVAPPTKSVMANVAKVLAISAHHGFSLAAAHPSRYRSGIASAVFGIPVNITYDCEFPEHVRATLRACAVLLIFPIYWAAYTQMLSNLISQAGTMTSHGFPNDALPCISIFIVVTCTPLWDHSVLPWLRYRKLEPGPLTRICCGFLLCSTAMAWAAIVQHMIYSSPPCYRFPRTKECPSASEVHIAVQVPVYILLAFSEILVSITGLEYAFTQAPPMMKGLVMAIFLSTTAIGALLAMAFAPLTQHPRMIWLYGSLALLVGIAGISMGIGMTLFRRLAKE